MGPLLKRLNTNLLASRLETAVCHRSLINIEDFVFNWKLNNVNVCAF